ncbi:MAG: Hint domain-containing protein [Pseudomonadota bacterium]
MVLSTSDAIYLGNFADADTNEATLTVENTAIYQNTFGSAGSPLSDQIFGVTYDDTNSNGSLFTDNAGGTESISYDVGGGPETALVDSLAVVSLTVTYSNGSTQNFNNAVMYQDTNGNLFLTNSNFAGTDLNGTNNLPIQSINVTSIDTNFTGIYQNAFQSFICFVAGTLIDTPAGPRRIEDLAAGDLVTTLDDGPQPIRWIGSSKVRVTEKLAPVRISRGSLGNGVPLHDLYVSQQHRMLIRSRIAVRMFGDAEVLVPAKRLIVIDGIDIVLGRADITYYHLLLDRHQIVMANGAPSESLLPGPQALQSMGAAAREEILAIFPDLMVSDARAHAARPIPPGKRQRQLCDRHARNGKRLLQQV